MKMIVRAIGLGPIENEHSHESTCQSVQRKRERSDKRRSVAVRIAKVLVALLGARHLHAAFVVPS